MGQYQRKIGGPEFAAAVPERSVLEAPDPAPKAIATTEIDFRLWMGPEQPLRALTWASESAFVYMIADLIAASHGQLSNDSSGVMQAQFESPKQALVAARRIQTAALEFAACSPEKGCGAAILVRSVRAGTATRAIDLFRRGLTQSRRGQILVADEIRQSLGDIGGMEFQPVVFSPNSSLQADIPLCEFVWADAEQERASQALFANFSNQPNPEDSSSFRATVMVDAPFVSSATAPEDHRTELGSEVHRIRVDEAVFQPQRPSDNLLLDEEPSPLITRFRLILGAVAVVLVVGLISVLHQSPGVTKPARVQPATATDVSAAGDTAAPPRTIKEQPATPTPPGVPTTPVSTEQPIGTPPATPISAEKRAKSKVKARDGGPREMAPPVGDFGGLSVKDIPRLLQMARSDAGAGNYDRARTEYEDVLRMEPNNVEAREGLRKLSLIKSDEE